MKLILLQPPIQDFYDTEVRLQPLGLTYLKAAVGRHLPRVRVVVKDYRQGWGRRTVALPRELAHLREYYPCPDRSPFSTFHNYYHFGAPFAALAEDVAREEPDLVGISSLFSAYHRQVLECARAIKARRPVPIVVGGSHASAAPLSLLQDPAVDWVIRGEGERPLVELLSALDSGADLTGISNLVWKRSGEPACNPTRENYPLAELPHPDWSDLPPGRYRFGGSPLAALLASRGCPHRCSFCAGSRGPGESHRRRAVEDILAEIRTRWEEGYRVLDFEDDNLTLSRAETEALCRRLIAEYPPGELTLLAMNGISYLALDPALLALLKQSGFSRLNLSLVSRSAEVCARHRRPHDLAKYQEVVREAVRLGMGVVSYQILGLPEEDLGSMVETLTFSARLPVLLGASPFYLPPGSPLAAEGLEPSAEDLVRCRLTALGPGGDGDTRDDVYTLFVATRVLNFLKGLRGLGPAASLAGALGEARRLGGRAALGAHLLHRLLTEGTLFAATPDGLRPLPRFRAALFRNLWARIGSIAALDGGRVFLG